MSARTRDGCVTLGIIGAPGFLCGNGKDATHSGWASESMCRGWGTGGGVEHVSGMGEEGGGGG